MVQMKILIIEIFKNHELDYMAKETAENTTEQCSKESTQSNKKLKKAELKDRGYIGTFQHHI